MVSKCDHPKFMVNGEVTRLSDVLDGPVTGYSVDVRVSCEACGLPFHFVGLPGGLSPEQATMSVDQSEARLPLVPGQLSDLDILRSAIDKHAAYIRDAGEGARRVMHALQGKDVDA